MKDISSCTNEYISDLYDPIKYKIIQFLQSWTALVLVRHLPRSRSLSGEAHSIHAAARVFRGTRVAGVLPPPTTANRRRAPGRPRSALPESGAKT